MRDALNSLVVLANHCGETYWNFAATMFVQIIVLVVVLFGLDLLLRNKVRAVVRYWVWLLVLAKLVMPTHLSTPASVAYWPPASEAALTPAEPMTAIVGRPRDVAPTTSFPAFAPNPADTEAKPPVASAAAIQLPAVAPPAAAVTPIVPVAWARIKWPRIAFSGWLIGLMVLLSML
jgi:hypothetical protein